MKRHYLFALVDGGGNVPPELSAARQLLARGHTVTVLAEDSVMEDVRATGAEMIRWLRAPNRKDRRPENDPARDWECTYPWQLVDRIAKTLIVGPAADYAHDVSDAINRRRPDVVICSMFCLGGMVAAEAAGIPFVASLQMCTRYRPTAFRRSEPAFGPLADRWGDIATVCSTA